MLVIVFVFVITHEQPNRAALFRSHRLGTEPINIPAPAAPRDQGDPGIRSSCSTFFARFSCRNSESTMILRIRVTVAYLITN